MSTYAAPIRDMKFAIKELIGLDDVAGLPGCEDLTPDVVDAVLEEAGKFATGVLDPLNRAGDATGAKLNNNVVTSAPGFADAFTQFSQGGWTGLNCDPQYGGQGLPHILSAQTSEMWNSANMSFCLCRRWIEKGDNDGNGRCGAPECSCGNRIRGEDHIHVEPDQFLGKSRKTIGVALCSPELNFDIAAFHIP